MITADLQRAAIVAARQRQQHHLAQAAAERNQMIAHIRQGLDDEALTVIQVAADLGVTRKAVYKMLDR